MFEVIRQKLSLKVSLSLALITLPTVFIAAYVISSRQVDNLEQLTIANAQTAARGGAKMYAAVLETGLDGDLFSIKDLLEPTYEEIKGFDFGDNPRFHTKYDYYTDRLAVEFQNTILQSSPELIYAVGTDLEGYLPTHNPAYAAPMTGDRAKDLGGNRNKRKFTTPMHRNAAKNMSGVLVQSYTSDAGERSWDVSAPIFVKGQHYGAFRVGASRAVIESHKQGLLAALYLILGSFGLITVTFIFFTLRRAMRPLEHLSVIANECSTGENLDKPIKATSKDEVGQMASSLNRLRSSLQAAMARLGA